MAGKPLTSLDQHIADRIRLARELRHETATHVGEVLDIRPQQYSRYERGENRVSASLLYRIARYFDLPIAWFYQHIDDESDEVLKSLSETAERYSAATEDDEVTIIAAAWRSLRHSQRQSVLQLLESMISPGHK